MGEFFSNFAIILAKTSALLFYSRVSHSIMSPPFRWTIRITHVMVAILGLWLFWALLFQCVPVESEWNFTLQKHCLVQRSEYIGCCTPDFILDVIILLIPIPLLWKLQMLLKRKLLTLAVFVTGSA